MGGFIFICFCNFQFFLAMTMHSFYSMGIDNNTTKRHHKAAGGRLAPKRVKKGKGLRVPLLLSL